MTLSDLGEFGFIRRISQHFPQAPLSDIIGIGDDCAVIPQAGALVSLVTTDMLIEDRHFIMSKIKPQELGYKALAVNLSDIAAMGGQAQYAFLSLGIPANLDLSWIDGFFLGLNELASQSNTLLLGGDTTQSADKFIINILVIGMAQASQVKTRDSAQVGDVLCLTDLVGDSGGGLKILLEDLPSNKDHDLLIQKHYLPRPHLEEGQWLAQEPGVRAMIDVSDGIASDVHRIMQRSQVGIEIFIDQIPISPTLQRVARQEQWDALEIALGGGEDYCLMLSVEETQYTKIAQRFERHFKKPLYAIGKIMEADQGLLYTENGQNLSRQFSGFDHFK